MTTSLAPAHAVDVLLQIMAALRTPGTGCPWDLVQTFESILPYTIEEAYEVADAIERRDLDDLKDELGDLFLQVVFHARIAEEAGAFAFGEVVEAITAKLIRRHPHVFGSARDLRPDDVKRLWSIIKSAETAERLARKGSKPQRQLDGVPSALPALTRALKLQSKAAEVGFDWNDPGLVMDKIREEVDEVMAVLDAGQPDALQDEIGDLLFTVVNLARHQGIDPEQALRAGNAKFERRFAHIEDRLSEQGLPLRDASLTQMEALWQDAKGIEKA